MATVLFTIPPPTRIYLTLIATATGGMVYLAVLIVIDKEARLLIQSIWQEIKCRVKKAVT